MDVKARSPREANVVESVLVSGREKVGCVEQWFPVNVRWHRRGCWLSPGYDEP